MYFVQCSCWIARTVQRIECVIEGINNRDIKWSLSCMKILMKWFRFTSQNFLQIKLSQTSSLHKFSSVLMKNSQHVHCMFQICNRPHFVDILLSAMGHEPIIFCSGSGFSSCTNILLGFSMLQPILQSEIALYMCTSSRRWARHLNNFQASSKSFKWSAHQHHTLAHHYFAIWVNWLFFIPCG